MCSSGWAPQYSPEIVAFQKWVPALGAWKNSGTCHADALVEGHYTQDTTFTQQVNGATSMTLTGAANVPSAVFFAAFGPQAQYRLSIGFNKQPLLHQLQF